MTLKVEHEGQEIEVYTAEEVTAREAAARTAVEGEFKPKLEEATTELGKARVALTKRGEEFAQFRKLSDEQIAQLAEKDQIIYNNQLAMETERQKGAEASKNAKESAVSAAIRAKVGTDAKLYAEVEKMYKLVGLDDATPEGITSRVSAALGALGTTQPDLLASAGFSIGGFEPPKPKEGSKSYADSDAGKLAAAELGIIIEEPKK